MPGSGYGTSVGGMRPRIPMNNRTTGNAGGNNTQRTGNAGGNNGGMGGGIQQMQGTNTQGGFNVQGTGSKQRQSSAANLQAFEDNWGQNGGVNDERLVQATGSVEAARTAIVEGYAGTFYMGRRGSGAEMGQAVDQLYADLQSGDSNRQDAATFALVASRYKNSNNNYDNGQLQKLLNATGNQDLANRPHVGENGADIETLSAVTAAIRRGTLELGDIYGENGLDALGGKSVKSKGGYDKAIQAVVNGDLASNLRGNGGTGNAGGNNMTGNAGGNNMTGNAGGNNSTGNAGGNNMTGNAGGNNMTGNAGGNNSTGNAGGNNTVGPGQTESMPGIRGTQLSGEEISKMIQDIQKGIDNGTISAETGTALIGKLQEMLQKVEQGQDTAADEQQLAQDIQAGVENGSISQDAAQQLTEPLTPEEIAAGVTPETVSTGNAGGNNSTGNAGGNNSTGNAGGNNSTGNAGGNNSSRTSSASSSASSRSTGNAGGNNTPVRRTVTSSGGGY